MTDDELLDAWERGELEVVPPPERQKILFRLALDRIAEQRRLAEM